MDEERRAELERSWVAGPMPRHDAPIHLAPYDPAWPALFEGEARRIRAALGERVLLLEHVGSTSVPGLAAKPIIDIVVVLADSSDEPSYIPALEATGYTLVIREPEWHEHRMLRGTEPKVNLHVFSEGSEEAARMLAFRDRLRTHDDERDAYEAAKRDLAARQSDYVQGYADAKGEVVEGIIGLALAAREDAGADG